MLNKVIVMGRFVQNPELKYTPSNVPVVSFTVAVNRDYKDQNGQYPTDFLDCVAWRNTAEFVSRYFQKGSLCVVEGSLQARMWEDKNGSKRKTVEISVSNVHFAESKRSSQEGGNYAPNYDVPAAPSFEQFDSQDDFAEVGDDDELPF